MPTAQVVTITEKTAFSVKEIIWDWLSTDAGVVVGSVTTYPYTGRCIYCSLESDAATTDPTDQWDCTVKDADGVDVLKGLGADVTKAATVYKADSDGLGAVVESKLTLAVSGAGNAKGGIVRLFIR
jgi:hypothetical protein